MYEILNSPDAIAFRRRLDVQQDPICSRCVCTMTIATPCRSTPAPPPVSALVRALCEPWMFYKRTILRPRLSRAVFERVNGRQFVVWPGVLNPVIFRAGRYLAEFIGKTA